MYMHTYTYLDVMVYIFMKISIYISTGGGDSVMVVEDGWLVTKGNVLAILSLGCSIISIAFINCRLIFFTYPILAGLHYL
jgi:hypothetical protein